MCKQLNGSVLKSLKRSGPKMGRKKNGRDGSELKFCIFLRVGLGLGWTRTKFRFLFRAGPETKFLSLLRAGPGPEKSGCADL